MVLKPLISEHRGFDIGLMMTSPCSLHGLWSGYCVLDDGTKLEIDGFLGHAEDIMFKW